ncbi:MAG: hypothetical protein MHM6MM_000189 [Cercozoa sp. M6MM]
MPEVDSSLRLVGTELSNDKRVVSLGAVRELHWSRHAAWSGFRQTQLESTRDVDGRGEEQPEYQQEDDLLCLTLAGGGVEFALRCAGTERVGERVERVGQRVTCLRWHPKLPLCVIGWSDGALTFWQPLGHDTAVAHREASMTGLAWSGGSASLFVSCDTLGRLKLWRMANDAVEECNTYLLPFPNKSTTTSETSQAEGIVVSGKKENNNSFAQNVSFIDDDAVLALDNTQKQLFAFALPHEATLNSETRLRVFFDLQLSSKACAFMSQDGKDSQREVVVVCVDGSAHWLRRALGGAILHEQYTLPLSSENKRFSVALIPQKRGTNAPAVAYCGGADVRIFDFASNTATALLAPTDTVEQHTCTTLCCTVTQVNESAHFTLVVGTTTGMLLLWRRLLSEENDLTEAWSGMSQVKLHTSRPVQWLQASARHEEELAIGILCDTASIWKSFQPCTVASGTLVATQLSPSEVTLTMPSQRRRVALPLDNALGLSVHTWPDQPQTQLLVAWNAQKVVILDALTDQCVSSFPSSARKVCLLSPKLCVLLLRQHVLLCRHTGAVVRTFHGRFDGIESKPCRVPTEDDYGDKISKFDGVVTCAFTSTSTRDSEALSVRVWRTRGERVVAETALSVSLRDFGKVQICSVSCDGARIACLHASHKATVTNVVTQATIALAVDEATSVHWCNSDARVCVVSDKSHRVHWFVCRLESAVLLETTHIEGDVVGVHELKCVTLRGTTVHVTLPSLGSSHSEDSFDVQDTTSDSSSSTSNSSDSSAVSKSTFAMRHALLRFAARVASFADSDEATDEIYDEALDVIHHALGSEGTTALLLRLLSGAAARFGRSDIAERLLGRANETRALRALFLTKRLGKCPVEQSAQVAAELGKAKVAESLLLSHKRNDEAARWSACRGHWKHALKLSQSKELLMLAARHCAGMGNDDVALKFLEKADGLSAHTHEWFLRSPQESLEDAEFEESPWPIKWRARVCVARDHIQDGVRLLRQIDDHKGVVQTLLQLNRLIDAAEYCEVLGDACPHEALLLCARALEYRLTQKSDESNDGSNDGSSENSEEKYVDWALRFLQKCAPHRAALFAHAHGRLTRELALALLEEDNSMHPYTRFGLSPKDAMRKMLAELLTKQEDIALATRLRKDANLHVDVTKQDGQAAEGALRHGDALKAAQLFLAGGLTKQALLALQGWHGVPEESLCEELLQTAETREERHQFAAALGEILVKRKEHARACKYLAQAGDYDGALKALIRADRPRKVAFFAKKLRAHPQLLEIAGNYFQRLFWRLVDHETEGQITADEARKLLLHFYTKSGNKSRVRRFHEAMLLRCIETRDYDAAEREVTNALHNTSESDEAERWRSLTKQAQQLHDFLAASDLLRQHLLDVHNNGAAPDGDENNKMARALAMLRPLIESDESDVTVRKGDVYGLLVEFFDALGDARRVTLLLKKMSRQLRVPLSQFVDQELLLRYGVAEPHNEEFSADATDDSSPAS